MQEESDEGRGLVAVLGALLRHRQQDERDCDSEQQCLEAQHGHLLLFGGAALWLVACRLPIVEDAWDVRVLLSCGIIAAYTWATAYEFWRGRSEPLVSRWPAIFMLFTDGSLYLLRTPLGAMLPWLPTSNQVFESVQRECVRTGYTVRRIQFLLTKWEEYQPIACSTHQSSLALTP